jgi:trimeric autotransporter adhesin
VAVTSQNGVNTLDYIITVTRKPSTNDALTSLQLKPFESLVKTTGPDFADYTVSVPNNISSIAVIATASDPTAVITVNGTVATSGTASTPVALTAGSNTITTTVTAQDGVTTRNYVITITRAPSSNAILSKLSTSPVVTLTSVTGPGYKNYTGSVPNTTATIKILPVSEDATATIQVNGVAVASGSASKGIGLTVGSNTITTIVTAQDGVTKNSYIMTITRAAGPVNIPDETVSVEQPATNLQLAADEVNVHQGVSPNGDGINDVLKIDGITQYPENTLTIMNRNGSVVYEAKGYDNQTKVFDGHSNKNGQMQLPGTYFFSLEYTVKGVSKRKTGYIVLKY